MQIFVPTYWITLFFERKNAKAKGERTFYFDIKNIDLFVSYFK